MAEATETPRVLNRAYVVIDAAEGSMTRYEHRGQLRRTHSATAGKASTFGQDLVEQMRRGFLSQFYCGPPLGVPGGDDSPGAPAAVAAGMALAA